MSWTHLWDEPHKNNENCGYDEYQADGDPPRSVSFDRGCSSHNGGDDETAKLDGEPI